MSLATESADARRTKRKPESEPDADEESPERPEKKVRWGKVDATGELQVNHEKEADESSPEAVAIRKIQALAKEFRPPTADRHPDVLCAAFDGSSPECTHALLDFAIGSCSAAFQELAPDMALLNAAAKNRSCREQSVYAHMVILNNLLTVKPFAAHVREHCQHERFDRFMAKLDFQMNVFCRGLNASRGSLARVKGDIPTWPASNPVAFVMDMRDLYVMGTYH